MNDNIALIGNGYWGSKIQKYIHHYFSLKVVADSKTDLDDIWNDKSIGNVIIATPIGTHYDIAKVALRNGKNILIEKPMAMTEERCVELIDLANKYGVKIGVEYTQTFSRSVLSAVDIINSGDIGSIEYIEMSTKHLGRFMDHNVYWLLASHHLSILDMINPGLENLKFRREDHMFHNGLCTTGSIVFDGDVKGRIDVSTNYTGKEMRFTVYGSKGNVVYNPLDIPTISTVKYDKIYRATPPGLITSRITNNYLERDNILYSVEYFKNLIEGNDKSNAYSSMLVTRAIQEAMGERS